MIGLVSGVRFVLGRVADAVNEQLQDEDGLREQLLVAQLRHELGEIGDDELAAVEADVMGHLRRIREAKLGPSPSDAGVRITGAEASFVADEEHE